MRHTTGSLFTTIALNPASAVPLYRQLCDALRSVILSGQLRAGARLPSTRALAGELGIARSTVLVAFEQLLAEGYLEGKRRSGTYVAPALPDELLRTRQRTIPASQPVQQALSRRGALLVQAAELGAVLPYRSDGLRLGRSGPPAFDGSIPALEAFPYAVWERLAARCWRTSARGLTRYSAPAGYGPLREAIAAYLGPARGVHCTPEQVIVVGSGHQAMELVAQVLLDPGEAAWIEDPGYRGAAHALLGAGARLISVPVDGHGLDVAAGVARCPTAKLAFVTPSHQVPLGVTMSLSRRLAMLEWAREAGAWILEDDYDGEFRYVGQPLGAMQGLDTAGRVIYLGTFSKVLFPALRLAYLVVPAALADAFVDAHLCLGVCASLLNQAVLTEFMAEGHFVRHIRRMRRLYAARQAALVEAAAGQLSGLLEVQTRETGLDLVGWLPQGVDDWAVSRRAAAYGVQALPLSSFSREATTQGGLLLGFAAVDVQEMPAAVRQLAVALRETMHSANGRSTRLVGSGPGIAPTPSMPSPVPSWAGNEIGDSTYELRDPAGQAPPSRPWSAATVLPATAQSYLTTTQAAQEFGYSSPSTLRKAMRDGKLRYVRVGPRTLLTTREWVTDWHTRQDGRGHRRGQARPHVAEAL